MQSIDPGRFLELYGSVLPLAILLIEDDEDRAFLSDFYIQYKPLMYSTASKFFAKDFAELEDVVGETVERICKNCDKIKAVECNKRYSYLISIIRHVCYRRLATIRKQNAAHVYSTDQETLEQVPGADDVHALVFDKAYASDLLNSFPELSTKDKDLIRMRHIDMLDYDEIAEVCGINEGAARTAVSRAKKRLEHLATQKKWNDDL